MGKLIAEISMSLDGFVAGPNPSLDDPLGQNGERLHEWVFPTKAWREPHGMEGGEDNVDSEIVEKSTGRTGATIMGRHMFSGGSGGWEDDPRANGWWGDEPPFHHPVFVLTHHERDPLELGDTTFTFVTEGIESAAEQARAAAGDRDVKVAGGGEAIAQYLRAGQIEELLLHVVPLFLGSGAPLFEGHVASPPGRLDLAEATESPTGVMHLTYRPGR